MYTQNSYYLNSHFLSWMAISCVLSRYSSGNKCNRNVHIALEWFSSFMDWLKMSFHVAFLKICSCLVSYGFRFICSCKSCIWIVCFLRGLMEYVCSVNMFKKIYWHKFHVWMASYLHELKKNVNSCFDLK